MIILCANAHNDITRLIAAVAVFVFTGEEKKHLHNVKKLTNKRSKIYEQRIFSKGY